MWSAEDIIVCNFWIYKILLLCCMNSVFRRLIRYILREALIVYWLIDAALIGIFFHDSFLFWNRNFCQTLFLDHAMQQKAKQHFLLLLKYFNCKYFSILATSISVSWLQSISVSWLQSISVSWLQVFQYLGYKYFSILATSGVLCSFRALQCSQSNRVCDRLLLQNRLWVAHWRLWLQALLNPL